MADSAVSTAQMMSWITDVVDFGIRRPGSAADDACEQWCAQRLAELGVQDVRLEPVEVARWEPGDARVRVWSPTEEPHELRAFALPYTRPVAEVSGMLAAFSTEDVSGQIAVETVTPMQLPGPFVRSLATASFDPDGQFNDLVQTLPFGPRIVGHLDPVIDVGAVGYIGIADFPWDTRHYYVPYDAVDRDLPAVWVSGSDGARITALMHRGDVSGAVEVDATTGFATSHNVVGTLDGASDEWVIIGSHHDAPWASAVEDASGIALVLAQAAYWASRDPRDRPHNLLFVLHAGHMAGGAGCTAMIDRHRDVLDRAVLAVHLEHAAAECDVEGGELVPTGEPEVRWWFTSQDADLEAAVLAALVRHRLHRSLVLPPTTFGEFPPTDGGAFHTVGVPLVNFLTAPMYLFDARDTVDKVHQPSLVPVTQAVVDIVNSTRGHTAAAARTAISGLSRHEPAND